MRLPWQFTPYYFRKPIDFDEFLKVSGLIRQALSQASRQEADAGKWKRCPVG